MVQSGRQEDEAVHYYTPYPPLRIQRKADALDEMRRQCSRFRFPRISDVDFDARLSGMLDKLDPFGGESHLITKGVPLNWQLFAEYLFEKGLTTSRQFHTKAMPNDMPQAVSASLRSADLTEETDGRMVFAYGFGAAGSFEESMSKAVGELLERYFLSVYRTEDLFRAPFSDMQRMRTRALDIRELNDFSPSQRERFPRFTRDETKPICWVKGQELLSGDDAYIPAQLVYWGYKHARDSVEPILNESNTSGCAGHFSRDEAILSSLLELIERDGFLIYWLNSIPPEIIDPTTISDPEVVNLLRYIRRYGIEPYLLDITSDIGVPSCICALVDRSSIEPVIAIGGGTGFKLRSVVFQAAGEALSVLSNVYRRETYRLPQSYEPFTDTRIMREERLQAWKGQEMYERFSFFLSGRLKPAEGFMGDANLLTTPQQQLQSILNKLRQMGNGYEVYAYEIHNKILRDLGFHVARTVVPAFIPLYLTESDAPLAARRLRDVPPLLGHTAAPVLNPWPHPFP